MVSHDTLINYFRGEETCDFPNFNFALSFAVNQMIFNVRERKKTLNWHEI